MRRNRYANHHKYSGYLALASNAEFFLSLYGEFGRAYLLFEFHRFGQSLGRDERLTSVDPRRRHTLFSETEESELCAQALVNYYQNRGFPSEAEKIEGLNYREGIFCSRGLRALVSKLVEVIEEKRKKGYEVLINATGGFKAESAYALLVGMLFRVPVYYIHEVFQNVVEMPVVPVSWDYSFLAEYEEFFHFLHADLRTKDEVREVLPTIPTEVRSLLTEEERYIFLSPAGEAFFQAYLNRIEEEKIPIFFSRTAWEAFRSFDSTVQENFRRILRKLRLPEVRRNRARSIRIEDVSCFVYPDKKRDERVFFCEREGNLYVCALGRHSDQSYERLITKGVRCWKQKDFTPFES